METEDEEIMQAVISIHAPRVRCDGRENVFKAGTISISIHAPRVRCDRL